MTMGVYCIQLEKEDYWCSYVGISKNIEQRWRQHKIDLKGDYHKNKYLQHSWNKHGERRFEFHILKQVDNYDELYNLEKEYAYSFGYGDFDLCFNIGSPGEKSSMLDKHHTEKTKQKIREAQKGEKSSWFGKNHTEETKRKISEANKGEKHHNFGKKHTEETKRKMSEATKGEKHSQTKLSELQARFILTVKLMSPNYRNRDFSVDELSSLFEIGRAGIEHIFYRNTWKHIESLPIEEYEIMKQELLSKKEV